MLMFLVGLLLQAVTCFTPPAAAQQVLSRCAVQRSPGADEVINVLLDLECSRVVAGSLEVSEISGVYELVFSSAVAELPLVGGLLKGYLPNKELITFDFETSLMSLAVETLPFIPSINIYGDELTWDADGSTLSYRIRSNQPKPLSTWTILYADAELVAARSSVTGLNVIKRV